jgi:hypothetical protein
MSADDLPEQRVKHLELIQAVITRLGNDSFLVKGWAVTVSGVFLGFSVTSKHAGLALVSILPATFFWGLDTYYLRAERLFRALYERARVAGPGYVPFGMDATSRDFLVTVRAGSHAEVASFWRTAWRPTLRYLYVGLVVAALVVAAVVSRWGSEKSTPKDRFHFVSSDLRGP